VLEDSFDSPRLDSGRLKTLFDDAGSLMKISKKDLGAGKKKKKPKRSSKQIPETSLSVSGKSVLQTLPFSHTHKAGRSD
jgi:hypothetical protein